MDKRNNIDENKEENINDKEQDEVCAEVVDDTIDDEDTYSNTEENEINKKSKDDEYKDKFQRLLADFSNYKQREEKAKQEFMKFATKKLIEDLLPVLDSFDRALKDKDKEDPFIKGFLMTNAELYKILNKEGLEEIISDGEKFDPNLHHAVMMEDNSEVESQHIIETFQKGYKLNEKVIRPAMVKVSN